MTRTDLDTAANNAKTAVHTAHATAFAKGNGNTGGATTDLNRRFDALIARYCKATDGVVAELVREFNTLAADAEARSDDAASDATAVLFSKGPRGRVR